MSRSTIDGAPNRSNDKRRSEHKGKAILLTLGPTLRERGVPLSRYIVVDVDSGEFVTGQSAAEAAARFKIMHPRSSGWLQRPDQGSS
jgi:hypothetical protein